MATLAPPKPEERPQRLEWVDNQGALQAVAGRTEFPPEAFERHLWTPVGPVPRTRMETLSRAVNVGLAIIAMILLAPVFLVIAIALRLSSPGPIFYTQARSGLDRRWNRMPAYDDRRREDLGGKVFTIVKFRTMEVDAERDSGAVWAQQDDPRVHRLGRFMRKFRIDELPQLWNVLKGDMNLVGPRPERPFFVTELRREIPEYQFRNRVKPGITGLAQINQDYDSSVSDVRSKVRWDLEYIERQGLGLDLWIMLLTLPSMLTRFRGR